MKKIVYYINGHEKSKEILNKDNLKHIRGMKVKCYMSNGTNEIGFADPDNLHDNNNYDGLIHEHIYLWTWDNLDEESGELIGGDDSAYNRTFKAIKIEEIEKIDALVYSNPRWGTKLTNKFKINSDNIIEKEKQYYYLTVKYESFDSDKEYNYISDDTNVDIGDKVLVDMTGKLTTAIVLKTAYLNDAEVPYPLEKTKKIIKKVDENFDIELCCNSEKISSNKSLNMDIEDTKLELCISNYDKDDKEHRTWTKTFLVVKSMNFNYSINSELMTSTELNLLYKKLKQLLHDELDEKETISFFEPDLEFELYPKINLRDTGNYIYIREGEEIQDIIVEISIYLTNRNGVYTGQRYVLSLAREEIEIITEYISKIIENNKAR